MATQPQIIAAMNAADNAIITLLEQYVAAIRDDPETVADESRVTTMERVQMGLHAVSVLVPAITNAVMGLQGTGAQELLDAYRARLQ